MNSLIIISSRNNFEFRKNFFVLKMDKFFKENTYEKIYLVFYQNNLIDEYWCKCIPISDYKDGYIQHLNYDKDFIRQNIDYLQKYLIDDFQVNDNITLFNNDLPAYCFDKLFNKLQENHIQLKIVNELEELR